MRWILAPTDRPLSTLVFGLGLIAALTLLAAGPIDALAQAPPIARDQAVERVAAELGGSLAEVRLFASTQPLAAGTVISAWHREVFRVPASGWFLFVDLHPGANWEHPCSYYLVDAASGALRRFEATTPPLNLPELTEITTGRDNPPSGMSEEALRRYSERLRTRPKPAAAQTRGQAYAFIISGGANQSNNHIRYWNDSAFIYRTLVEYYGYADDHIRVCISDGTSTAVDRSDGTNSPTDLDGDGDADIEYPATTTYLTQVFGELAATLTPSDQLFLFTTDHGGQESGQDCYLNLWNLEELRDDQMAAYLATLPCETIVCTFEQCFSGGMVDDLQGDGRVIATAANWDEYSWAMGPNYIYDTFVYYWTSAVAGETPTGTPVDADTNNDGLVSMREAFVYAEAMDNEDETPQYSSTPAALGEVQTLLGNLQGVYLTLSSLLVDDDALGASSGDGDGLIEYGETVELTATLLNLGQSGAPDVSGTLATASPYVTILQATGQYGAIPPEGLGSNLQPFILEVADGVPNGEPLGLILSLTEEPGEITLDLNALAPSYVVSVQEVDDRNGNGDGLADPGESVVLLLDFANPGACPTPEVTAALLSGGDFTCDETPIWVGVIPVGGHRTMGGFQVQIDAGCPPIGTGLLAVQLSGPDGYAAASSLRLPVGPWFDDGESDFAWTLGVTDDNATSGRWIRAEPVGTIYNAQQAQSEYDHSPDPAALCFVTGNGTPGGAAGEADVDGGRTTLLSPIFNLQGAASASISYWRWYTNNLGNSPGQDYWNVEVTSDGNTWVALEHTLASANSWTQQSFDLAGVIPFTNAVRFRFVADDTSPGSLVEAAVDDILVTIVRPPMGSGVDDAGLTVTGLRSCVPNPVRTGSVVSFAMATSGPVRLDLYDVAGRRVRVLSDGLRAAGAHRLEFRPVDEAGRHLPSGIYFLRMETPTLTQVRQVTLLR